MAGRSVSRHCNIQMGCKFRRDFKLKGASPRIFNSKGLKVAKFSIND